MFVTYMPGTEGAQSWDFDPGAVRASQGEMIERRAGKPFEQWLNDVRLGSVKARRVLLWHLMIRQGHALPYEDTPDFAQRELLVEPSLSELFELQAQTEKMKLSDEERQQFDAYITGELASARAREGDEPGPKAQ